MLMSVAAILVNSESTLSVKVAWFHIQRTPLSSALHLELSWDIIGFKPGAYE